MTQVLRWITSSMLIRLSEAGSAVSSERSLDPNGSHE